MVNRYMQEQQAYALSVPFMATAGNHEQFENATSYLSRFRMPGPESGGKNSECVLHSSPFPCLLCNLDLRFQVLLLQRGPRSHGGVHHGRPLPLRRHL